MNIILQNEDIHIFIVLLVLYDTYNIHINTIIVDIWFPVGYMIIYILLEVFNYLVIIVKILIL